MGPTIFTRLVYSIFLFLYYFVPKRRAWFLLLYVNYAINASTFAEILLEIRRLQISWIYLLDYPHRSFLLKRICSDIPLGIEIFVACFVTSPHTWANGKKQELHSYWYIMKKDFHISLKRSWTDRIEHWRDVQKFLSSILPQVEIFLDGNATRNLFFGSSRKLWLLINLSGNFVTTPLGIFQISSSTCTEICPLKFVLWVRKINQSWNGSNWTFCHTIRLAILYIFLLPIIWYYFELIANVKWLS